MKTVRQFLCVGLLGTIALSGCSSGNTIAPLSAYAGQVYAQTNAVGGNAVVHYGRRSNGQLVYIDTVGTGGVGVGAASVLNGAASANPLSSQGSLAISPDHTKLFAVNAGSNSVSAFTLSGSGEPQLVGTYPTGGMKPNSLAVHGSVLYVGHAVANTANKQLFGFTINANGSLAAIPSAQYGTTGSTPIFALAFNSIGTLLAATESATGKIDVYPVNSDGTLGTEVVNTSAQAGPTGVLFGDATHLFVAETHGGAANAGSVSSYSVAPNGSLSPVTTNVGDQQTASCWIALAPSGQFLIASNTPASDISVFSVSGGANVTLAQPVEGSQYIATPTTGPIESLVSADSQYFYQQYGSTGIIAAFQIQGDGSLVSVANGNGGNLPLTGSQGLTGY